MPKEGYGAGKSDGGRRGNNERKNGVGRGQQGTKENDDAMLLRHNYR